MAGGWTPPRLVAAVSEAGGLGSLAGAMLDPDALREQIREIRALTDQPFAVNLFAPLPAPSDRGLADWAALNGVPSAGRAPLAPSRFADQLSVVIDEQVPVLSFTFGIPPPTASTASPSAPRRRSPRPSRWPRPVSMRSWRRVSRPAGIAAPSWRR